MRIVRFSSIWFKLTYTNEIHQYADTSIHQNTTEKSILVPLRKDTPDCSLLNSYETRDLCWQVPEEKRTSTKLLRSTQCTGFKDQMLRTDKKCSALDWQTTQI